VHPIHPINLDLNLKNSKDPSETLTTKMQSLLRHAQ
jgi:hypothetical protein